MPVTVSATPRRAKRAAGGRPTAELCIVGGAGHVGLPLSIVFAAKGQRVLVHDIDREAMATIRQGTMPFIEQGAEPLLREVLAKGLLTFTSDPADIANVPNVVVIIGTPVDKFLNPSTDSLAQCIDQLLPYLSDDQLLVLRSTVYPGTTDWLAKYLRARGKRPLIAFCPERIVQGRAVDEIQHLPQIVSGITPEAEERAASLFARVSPKTVRMQPMEAEFAKLFCNAYRYIQFAATNQFYMIATSAGLDYYRILAGMKDDYPRMRDLPGAGFSAGPCLFKDTMQLSAFYDNEFSLGYTAMLVNEGLPLYLIQQLSARYDLSRTTVGLLGMAFKPDIDDARASLSYKLKKALRFRAKAVLTTDPYVKDAALAPVEEVIAKSDVLVLCIPHRCYQALNLRGKPVVDVWNFFGKGLTADADPARAARKRRTQVPA